MCCFSLCVTFFFFLSPVWGADALCVVGRCGGGRETHGGWVGQSGQCAVGTKQFKI